MPDLRLRRAFPAARAIQDHAYQAPGGCSYLRETGAGQKTILIFSDMKEELPPGAKRKLGGKELEGIEMIAMNVKRLGAEKLDPAAYRKRLATWEALVTASGALSWKVVLDPEELVKQFAREI